MDNYITLNDRTLIIQDIKDQLAVQDDNLSEGLKFKIPKMYNEVDLSTKQLYVDYENANGETGSTLIEAEKISVNNDMIEFTYYIPNGATIAIGKCKIALRFIEVETITTFEGESETSEDILKFRFKTLPIEIEVLEGINASLDDYIQANPTKVEEMENSIIKNEENIELLKESTEKSILELVETVKESKVINLTQEDLDNFEYKDDYTYMNDLNCYGGPLQQITNYVIYKKGLLIIFYDANTGIEYIKLENGTYFSTEVKSRNISISEIDIDTYEFDDEHIYYCDETCSGGPKQEAQVLYIVEKMNNILILIDTTTGIKYTRINDNYISDDYRNEIESLNRKVDNCYKIITTISDIVKNVAFFDSLFNPVPFFDELDRYLDENISEMEEVV